jgi:hypothetical protein
MIIIRKIFIKEKCKMLKDRFKKLLIYNEAFYNTIIFIFLLIHKTIIFIKFHIIK